MWKTLRRPAAAKLVADADPTAPPDAGAATPAPSPYLAARWVYDRRIDELEGRIRYHRGKEMALLAVIAILVLSLVTLAGQSSVRTMFVQVDPQGHALSYGAVANLPPPEEAVQKAAIIQFLEACRSIASDPVTQTRQSDRCTSFLRARARTYVDTYFSTPENNPHVLRKDIFRMVEIRKVERMAGFDDRWQLEWVEQDVAVRGGGATSTSWSGTIRSAVVSPENEDEFYANPLGVYVVDLTWTRVSDPRSVRLQDAQEVVRTAREQRLRETYREQRTDSVANDPR